MLCDAGFPDAGISASNDLDENLIYSLKTQGARINSWGVGTNLITAKGNPAFGGVYKLAAIQDESTGAFMPKIKLSENTEKVTNPGNKTIFRIYNKDNGKIKADLICLANETFDESKDLVIFDPIDTWKRTRIPGGSYALRELLVPVFKKAPASMNRPPSWSCGRSAKRAFHAVGRIPPPGKSPGSLRGPVAEALRHEKETAGRNRRGAGKRIVVPS